MNINQMPVLAILYDAGPSPATNGFALLSDQPDDPSFWSGRIFIKRFRESHRSPYTDKWIVTDDWTYPSYFSKSKQDFVEQRDAIKNLNDVFFDSPEEAFLEYMKYRDEIAKKRGTIGFVVKQDNGWMRKKWNGEEIPW